MPLLQLLRAFTFLVVVAAVLQDAFVVVWYVNHGLIGPRRLLHIVSVGIGLLFAYGFMLATVGVLFFTHAASTVASPMCIASAVFTMYGVHNLYLEGRRRVEQ